MTPVIYMKCCKVWPIVPGVRVGRCGLCGRRPEMASETEVLAYLKAKP